MEMRCACHLDFQKHMRTDEHVVSAVYVTIHSSIDQQSTTTQGRGSWTIVTICGEAQIGYSRPARGPAAVRPENCACL